MGTRMVPDKDITYVEDFYRWREQGTGENVEGAWQRDSRITVSGGAFPNGGKDSVRLSCAIATVDGDRFADFFKALPSALGIDTTKFNEVTVRYKVYSSSNMNLWLGKSFAGADIKIVDGTDTVNKWHTKRFRWTSFGTSTNQSLYFETASGNGNMDIELEVLIYHKTFPPFSKPNKARLLFMRPPKWMMDSFHIFEYTEEDNITSPKYWYENGIFHHEGTFTGTGVESYFVWRSKAISPVVNGDTYKYLVIRCRRKKAGAARSAFVELRHGGATFFQPDATELDTLVDDEWKWLVLDIPAGNTSIDLMRIGITNRGSLSTAGFAYFEVDTVYFTDTFPMFTSLGTGAIGSMESASVKRSANHITTMETVLENSDDRYTGTVAGYFKVKEFDVVLLEQWYASDPNKEDRVNRMFHGRVKGVASLEGPNRKLRVECEGIGFFTKRGLVSVDFGTEVLETKTIGDSSWNFQYFGLASQIDEISLLEFVVDNGVATKALSHDERYLYTAPCGDTFDDGWVDTLDRWVLNDGTGGGTLTEETNHANITNNGNFIKWVDAGAVGGTVQFRSAEDIKARIPSGNINIYMEVRPVTIGAVNIGVWIGDLNAAASNKGWLISFSEGTTNKTFKIWRRNADGVYTNVFTSGNNAWALNIISSWIVRRRVAGSFVWWEFILDGTLTYLDTVVDPANVYFVSWRYWRETSAEAGEIHYMKVAIGAAVSYISFRWKPMYSVLKEVGDYMNAENAPTGVYIDDHFLPYNLQLDNRRFMFSAGNYEQYLPYILTDKPRADLADSSRTNIIPLGDAIAPTINLQRDINDTFNVVKIPSVIVYPGNADGWTEGNVSLWKSSGSTPLTLSNDSTIFAVGTKSVKVERDVGGSILTIDIRFPAGENLSLNSDKFGSKKNIPRLRFWARRGTNTVDTSHGCTIIMGTASATSDEFRMKLSMPNIDQWYFFDIPFGKYAPQGVGVNDPTAWFKQNSADWTNINYITFRSLAGSTASIATAWIDGLHIVASQVVVAKDSTKIAEIGEAQWPITDFLSQSSDTVKLVAKAELFRLREKYIRGTVNALAIPSLIPWQKVFVKATTDPDLYDFVPLLVLSVEFTLDGSGFNMNLEVTNQRNAIPINLPSLSSRLLKEGSTGQSDREMSDLKLADITEDLPEVVTDYPS